MDREIIIVGLNHRSAPIEIRESVAFEEAVLHDGLARLRTHASIDEGVILSTCNRVEVVAATPDSATAQAELLVFLRNQQKDSQHTAFEDQHTYTYRGNDAVRHLFRVAASLDSMVVGEPQILGQLKTYYTAAQAAGTVGTILHRLFHRSFSVAKRVRTETGIGGGAVSMSSVAVDLAGRIFDRLNDKTVMLIGAGKMGKLMARHLQQAGIASLMVTNRTFERAVELAETMQGSPIRFDELSRYLTMADLVIGCAAAPELLVSAASVEKILKERKQRAMFFIDIGDRRNFDPGINELDNAYLYNIDDLTVVAEENLQGRSHEAAKAEAIVVEEVQGFCRWIGSLDQVPTIMALKARFEAVRSRELDRFLAGTLKTLSAEQRAAVNEMTSAMMNKILHGPITNLKKHTADAEFEEALYVAALRKLFDLEGK